MKLYLMCIGVMIGSAQMKAQNADDIIQQYYEATGGKALWAKVNAIKYTGHYVMGPGVQAPVNQYQSKEQVYSDFSWNGMTSKSARKGSSGWSYNPFGGKRMSDPMTQDQIKTSKLGGDVQGLMYDYAAKGYQVEYLGVEDFDGTDVHKIRLTTAEGDLVYYYFDVESHFLLKVYMRIKLSDREEKMTTNFSDFKKTKFGIILPFASNWANEDGEEGGLTQYTDIDINASIDPALLDMPKQ